MMFESTESRMALEAIGERVRSLKPGEHVTAKRKELRYIDGFRHNGAEWRPEDRIIESIIGGAYGWSYHHVPSSGDVVFSRSKDEGVRTYTSPDRRGL